MGAAWERHAMCESAFSLYKFAKQQDILQATFPKSVLCTLVFQHTGTWLCCKLHYFHYVCLIFNTNIVIVVLSRATVVVSYQCNRASVVALESLPPHVLQTAMLLFAAAIN